MDPSQIAEAGALSLVRLQRPDGSFRYRYEAGSKETLPGYNVLRHAGTIWCLLDMYKDQHDQHILQCCKNATTHLLSGYLRFFRDYRNVCICEKNKIKLGGNALSAMALLALYEKTGEPFLLSIAEQLCCFMLRERLEDGRFVDKRYFTSGKISSFTSMYYTGQALLAMLTLYRISGEEKWLASTMEIEKNLAAISYGVKEQSHWMLYSLELLAQYDASFFIYDHAAKIAGHILDNPEYHSWERSTPIACRSEGLLAFVRMRQSESQAIEKLKSRCLVQVESNLWKQQQFRLEDGTFIRGGGDRRHNEVRIDYIQHNVSSFLHYARITKGKNGSEQDAKLQHTQVKQ
jgi:hypothetical protein